jgi:hypothetical protein
MGREGTEFVLNTDRIPPAGLVFRPYPGDLRRDTPEQIARVLIENCTPSRAEKIAQAIRAELKRQRAAHAG